VTGFELLIGLAVVVGVVGVVVPVLPGTLLILGGVLAWAVASGTAEAWTFFALAAVLLVSGAVVKYALPGRSLKAAGVPSRTLVVGGLLGLVGFFVIPVVGLFVGFVLGVYLAEVQRLGRDQAGPSTRHALKAAGLSVLIELVTAVLAAVTYFTGALLT
jgi:uncharacterized protein YqgC (DUF456 family)